MIKKHVKYKDFDDNDREEDFYFNLTEAELTELELSQKGGLTKTIERIVAAQDSSELIRIFKHLVLTSYGEKSVDGKLFMKDEAITRAFSQTQAYSDIFMELAFDNEAAAAFVNGLAKTVKK